MQTLPRCCSSPRNVQEFPRRTETYATCSQPRAIKEGEEETLNINKPEKTTIFAHHHLFSTCSRPVLCYTFRVIRQTLDRQSKQHKNKSTNERKTLRFLERKTAGAQMKATFFSSTPPLPFFLSFFPFSPSQFLLEAFAYFKSLPKKIAQGQKWTICILKTQQRANGGRASEGERGRGREEQEGERKSPSK